MAFTRSGVRLPLAPPANFFQQNSLSDSLYPISGPIWRRSI